MHVILYGVIEETDDVLSIEGPFFHLCESNLKEAEKSARKLSSESKSKQYIPWIFKLEENERIPELIIRIRDGWFNRFKNETSRTHEIITKDLISSTCPFIDVDLNELLISHG